MKNIYLLISFFMLSFNSSAQTKIEIFDPSFLELIDSTSQLELLADGMKWAEGPDWDGKNNRLLFSDPALNTIFSWDEKNGKEVFLHPSGFDGDGHYSDEPGTNGLLINKFGKLIACDHGNRRIAVIDLDNKTKNLFAGNWDGKRFNSPNDICEHPAGYYFFTDPPYGLPHREKDTLNKEIPFNGVYCLTDDGRVSLLIDHLDRPNGIALSPKAEQLFVALSDGNNPYIMRYVLNGKSIQDEGTVFFDFKKHFPNESMAADGIKINKQGDVFAAAGKSIVVINKQGSPIGRIHTGNPTANCAFGDDGYLYITAKDKLMRVKLKSID